MKNTITGLFIGLLLVAPSFSYAQVASTTPATISDLDALKMQLIQVLLQEVQMLQAQLTALQAQADNTANDVATIKANTTPVFPTATGGAVDNTVAVVPFTVYQLVYEIKNDGSKGLYYSGNDTLSSLTVTRRENDVFNDTNSVQLTLSDPSSGSDARYVYRISLPQDIQTPGPYKVVLTSASGESATWLISLGYSGSQGNIFAN